MLHRKRPSAGGPVGDIPPPSAVPNRRDVIEGAATLASLSVLASLMPSRVEAAPAEPLAESQTILKKTICPFCSVGCSIWAEVQNGVWIGQEPVFESPINMGTHCAKGAATRELAKGDRRLKYPTKLVDGKWTRIPWQQAIDEIGDKLLTIRKESGPDSVFLCGSSKASNEQAYLQRKLWAFWGSNNCDHQARICHSTTVAGVASTYGYGAMTNSFNDIANSKSIFLLGGNPAEAHPVSMLHILRAKEKGAKLIVVDPRFTRTAAHADEYVRIRSGTDVALLWGVLREVLANGWEDKDYIAKRVWRFDEVVKEVQQWTPEETEHVTGVPAAQVKRIAEITAKNRPGTLIWCMGLTQSSIGNNKVRAASIYQLALGNIGVSGGGANIFRGHDNVQGATDIGPNSDTLPGYYGLSAGAWRHWAGVWDVGYEWLVSRFQSEKLMQAAGITISRWQDGVLERNGALEQPHPLRAMIYWGHSPNSQSRGRDVKKAMEALDLMVIIDPVPTASAVMSDRRDGVYLLPAGTTMEMAGSVTNSQRALQWREKVIEPIFEAKSDYEITYLLASKLGIAEEMFKHIEVVNNEPVPESVLREVNRGTWSIGYTGQSPERLKLHMQHQEKFDRVTSIGLAEPVKGEYYGLPWPCWSTPDVKHPGTPLLYDQSKPVAAGGLPFRAAWGTEHDGIGLLADNSAPAGSPIGTGYPEMTMAMLQRAGWDSELTSDERAKIVAVARAVMTSHKEPNGPAKQQAGKTVGESNTLARPENSPGQSPEAPPPGGVPERAGGAVPEPSTPPDRQQRSEIAQTALPGPTAPSLESLIGAVNWKTDLSGGIQRVALAHGIAPFGNGKARSLVWNYPDPVPKHREPLYTPRRDLLPKYRTHDDRRHWRLPALFWSVQQVDKSQEFPLVLTSGRLVEFEGGGDETRAISWLAELQQRMFVEINPADANAKGIRPGTLVWLRTPEGAAVRISALVTQRVASGTVFMPFHFAGMWMGEDRSARYPEGTSPWVVGEAANTATTYGYDPVTYMQETKTTLCRIEPA
ncbi:MAG: molybdopterin-dependent oxidoreductase [Hyphomicrobiaceae bacterium]